MINKGKMRKKMNLFINLKSNRNTKQMSKNRTQIFLNFNSHNSQREQIRIKI